MECPHSWKAAGKPVQVGQDSPWKKEKFST